MRPSLLLPLLTAGLFAPGASASTELIRGAHASTAVDGGLASGRTDRPSLDYRFDGGAVHRLGYGSVIHGVPLLLSTSTWHRWVGTDRQPRLQYSDVAVRLSAPLQVHRSRWNVELVPTVGFTVPTSLAFSPWTVLHGGGRLAVASGRVRAGLLTSMEYELIRASSEGRRPRPRPPPTRGPACRPEQFDCGPTSPADLRMNVLLLIQAQVWGPLSIGASTRVAYDLETQPIPTMLLPNPPRPGQRLWDTAALAELDLGRYAALTFGFGATHSLRDQPAVRLRMTSGGYDPYPGTWRGFVSLLLRTDHALSPLWQLP